MRYKGQRGSVVGLVAVALVALLGSIAVAFDLGRVVTAAQRTQDVADGAALAAMQDFPSTSYDQARWRIGTTVTANNVTTRGIVCTCNTGTGLTADVTFYAAGSSVPGYGTLGPVGQATRVNVRAHVPFYFAPALGLSATEVMRYAVCVVAPVTGGIPILPMWITETTPYQYGTSQQLLMATGPSYPGIPGNFGWLTPPSGSQDFNDLLKGYNLSQALLNANVVNIGDTVWGLTGERTGQWQQALQRDSDSRMSRATWAPFTGDTFSNFHKDNPRIMMVPICTYVDSSGSGGNAKFTITKFGVFWLESVASSGKSVTGRFIQYILPGAAHGGNGSDTGLWTTFLAR
jgi:Flp pilus assembly protein TadG